MTQSKRRYATRAALLLATTALTSPVLLGTALAQSLPIGGSVAAGSATISQPSATQLTVTQTSQSAVVNWQGFSIGQGSAVNFVQPNSSAAILNRVTGNTPSTIAGSLTANGQVYLVNPNGIAITRSGTVDTGGGFVASTLGISDGDFMAGKRTFTGNGASAEVSNAGTITVGRGGYAALIGGTVSNAGLISVPLGKVGLGSGEQAALDFSGDGFLQVAMPTQAGGANALIRNSGTIRANGGSVILSAATAREAARNAINISGLVQARSIGGHSGAIVIGGGAGGNVSISGKLSTAARRGTGGAIAVTGKDITLAGATIDASGRRGGGTVNIGGGRQGTGPLQRAETVAIDAATTIKADATSSGNGGHVTVWSDLLTTFAGTITARGGAISGNGGEAEVSGQAKLDYTGFTNLTAANGVLGNLLLDPYNITISTGTDSTSSGFTASGNDSVINATTLLTALSGANVTVYTGASGSQAGTITVTAPLSWTSGATLTLSAASDIALNSTISAAAGGLVLSSGGTITSTGAISLARFTLSSGNWNQIAATLPGFSAANFSLNGGSFLRATGGGGSSGNPYILTDIYGVQGIGSSQSRLQASYTLANDIDASGTATWNNGAGFNPIGNSGQYTAYSGSFNGNGHVISGLTINRSGSDYVGLFGDVGSDGYGFSNYGSVSNLGLVGGSINGRNLVGGIAGSVQTLSTISTSYSTATVNGANVQIGGLVGGNNGTITQSYASAAVNGAYSVGGLVGLNAGAITQSYATGAVNGTGGNVGSFTGFNSGTITQSYGAGAVVSSGIQIGGFTGYNNGTITGSFWDTQTTGRSIGVGSGTSTGVTGLTTAQARSSSNYSGWDFSAVWYQSGDLRPILRSEAASAVNGVVSISNLHQLVLMGANLSGSYALAHNIDASPTSGANAADIFSTSGWVPVGSSSTTFNGSLNGAGYTINGLRISRAGTSYLGLFGSIGSSGAVSNLGLVGGSVAGAGFVGSLAGNNSGTLTNVYATGSVTGTSNNTGGLVGVSQGTISRSYATGAVNGTLYVGGLVGLIYPSGVVSQSYATGAVSGGPYAGGLAGGSNGLVEQSYAIGNVSGSSPMGGLVGYNTGVVTQSYASGSVGSGGGLVGYNSSTGSITNSYWDTQTTGQGSAIGSGTAAVSATGLTTAQARSSASYSGWDFSSVWYQVGDMRPILLSEAASANGNGIITVSNLHQLVLMGANLSGNYVLSGNIDASATSGANASNIFSTSGWVPVGTTAGYFLGSLNGAGYTISGLTINRTSGPGSSYTGLFGYLGTGSTVSGVGLVGGSVQGSTIVGSLAGVNYGTITQSYSTASVTAAGNFVGGLVGSNQGTISQSYAAGAVSGGVATGGLAGSNASGATVTQSYATGNVSGTSSVGGLVGSNSGTVSQTYATGAVTGTTDVGGLAGYSDGTITGSVWNTLTSGQTAGVGNGATSGVTGLTTAQMQDLSSFATTYAGWDFTTVWAPPNQAGQGGSATAYYPQLYSLSHVIAVTASSASRTYGDSNPQLMGSYAGAASGDYVTGLGTLTTAATASSNVGSYAVNASGVTVTSAAGNSYRIIYVPNASGITITPRAATVTADTQSRSYGDANPTLTYTATGLINGDTLSGALTTAAISTSGVGTYAIGQGTLGNGNYSITYIGANLTITPRAITVTADAQSRSYGDANPALTYTATGLINGDTLAGALTTTAAATSGVGSYAIGQGSLGNGNYSITYTGANLTITPRAITVTADTRSRTYGDSNPALTYTVGGSGLVNGDTLSGSLATSAATTSNVGNYAITQGSLAASSNYAVSYVGASLAVAARPLTITAIAQSRVYGDANPTLSYTVGGSGLANGDTLSGVLTTLASPTSNVGNYAIAQGTLTASSNYTVTYVGADLAVTPRALSVVADAQSRVYGNANPALSYTAIGLINNDTLAGSLATAATTTSGIGSYAISQGTLGNANYSISYTGANLAITPRAITVTADAQTRVYGDANPALTYTVGGSGLVNGDTLAGSLATSATSTSGVGSYAITQGSLGNSNYAITYAGSAIAVTARPIIVTADAQSRAYGNTNPPLTYTVGGRGLVNGDTLMGMLATSADSSSAAGDYAITQNTLAASPNYLLTYVGANLTVTVPTVVDPATLASSVMRDGVMPPADTIPTDDLPELAISFGTGVFHADPRFDKVLICFGGGSHTASSCFGGGRGT